MSALIVSEMAPLPLVDLEVVLQGTQTGECMIVARHVGFYNPTFSRDRLGRGADQEHLERITAHPMATAINQDGDSVLVCQADHDFRRVVKPLVISSEQGEPMPLAWTRFILSVVRLRPGRRPDYRWGSGESATRYYLEQLPRSQQVLVSFHERNHDTSVWDRKDYTYGHYRDMLSALDYALK